MRNRHLTECLLLSILGIIFGAGPVHAIIPQDPNATLARDQLAAAATFNRETLLEAYREVGDRNPAWDEPTEAYLNAVVDYWSMPATLRTREVVDALDPLLRAAMAAGCTDPLVLYTGARVRTDMSNARSFRKDYPMAVYEAARRMPGTGYSPYRIFTALQNAHLELQKHNQHQARADEVWVQALGHLVRMLAVDDPPARRRIVAGTLNAWFNQLTMEQLTEIVARLDAERSIQPWQKQFTLGVAHIALAWRHRGTGWASTVDEAGWVNFRAHVNKARAHLTRAHQLDDSVPEAATEMIKVAMAVSPQPLPEMRLWFERAVRAEFDHLPAYNALEWGLEPRWHGSPEAMYAFALECFETQRFDTEVPKRLLNGLNKIQLALEHATDPKIRHHFWRLPDVYEKIEHVYTAYHNDRQAQGHGAFYRAQLGGYAYLCGRYEAVLRVYEEVGEDFDAIAVSNVNRAWPDMVAEAAAAVGPWADELDAALALSRQGDLPGALAAYQGLMQAELNPAPLRKHVRDRIQIIEWRLALDRGETVSLMSDAAPLAGWQAHRGEWKVDEQGGFHGVSYDEGLRLSLAGDFGTRWELTGRIDYPRSRYTPQNAAVLLGNVEVAKPPAVVMSFYKKHVYVGDLSYHGQAYAGEGLSEDGYTFRIRMRDGVVDVWIGDRQVAVGHAIEGFDPAADSRIALAGYVWRYGMPLRFSELRLAPLDGPAPRRQGPPRAP